MAEASVDFKELELVSLERPLVPDGLYVRSKHLGQRLGLSAHVAVKAGPFFFVGRR